MYKGQKLWCLRTKEPRQLPHVTPGLQLTLCRVNHDSLKSSRSWCWLSIYYRSGALPGDSAWQTHKVGAIIPFYSEKSLPTKVTPEPGHVPAPGWLLHRAPPKPWGASREPSVFVSSTSVDQQTANLEYSIGSCKMCLWKIKLKIQYLDTKLHVHWLCTHFFFLSCCPNNTV